MLINVQYFYIFTVLCDTIEWYGCCIHMGESAKNLPTEKPNWNNTIKSIASQHYHIPNQTYIEIILDISLNATKYNIFEHYTEEPNESTNAYTYFRLFYFFLLFHLYRKFYKSCLSEEKWKQMRQWAKSKQ